MKNVRIYNAVIRFTFILIIVAFSSLSVSASNQEIRETEPNNNKNQAQSIQKGITFVGNLSSRTDADWYKFAITTTSDVQFDVKISEKSYYRYCWDMTVYSNDGSSVLKTGQLDAMENTSFTMTEMKASTYYVKISISTGGNPFLNGYDDIDYYLSITPICKHQVGDWEITKQPQCLEAGERVQKCINCNEICNTEKIDATGHSFTEWTIKKPSTWKSLGEKESVCSVCGEIKTAKDWSKVWIIPSATVAFCLFIWVVIKILYAVAYKCIEDKLNKTNTIIEQINLELSELEKESEKYSKIVKTVSLISYCHEEKTDLRQNEFEKQQAEIDDRTKQLKLQLQNRKKDVVNMTKKLEKYKKQ